MMPITYTNRKGQTYTLRRGTTKTGKAHYYFSRQPKGEAVEQIPEGYEIRESVNGLPFLAKAHPQVIHPDEVALVEAIVSRHRQAHNYRVKAKGDRIEISERVSADPDKVTSLLQQLGGIFARRARDVRETLDQDARFSPVMRFVLVDEDTRAFLAGRWCYSGSINDWVDVGATGPLRRLARTLVPKLGTHAFFDLY